jgi:Na+/H+ antiporter NhaD/arsenite permease-like protein
MALLLSLFVITGGISLRGALAGTPIVNTAVLAFGALLANVIGTTGASLLLIRPLMRANDRRPRPVHVVVFFIFIVSNAGGLLTPLGDPPLFLGFLGVILFVYVTGAPGSALSVNRHVQALFQIAGMLVMAALSYKLTPLEAHAANRFGWAPIVEVGVVFSGVFLTMVPALHVLAAQGTALGLTRPWQFFWASGALSSFLDNAPTYLTFATLAVGVVNQLTGRAIAADNLAALAGDPVGAALLAAVFVRIGLHGRRLIHRQRPQTSWSRPWPKRAACACPPSSATWPGQPPSWPRSSSR